MIDWVVGALITWNIDITDVAYGPKWVTVAEQQFQQWAPSGITFRKVDVDPDITIRFSEDTPPGLEGVPWGAYAQITDWNVCSNTTWHMDAATIVVRPSLARKASWWVPGALAHEIGHALGLPHDPDDDTVMGVNSTTYGTVTSKDLNKIRMGVC